MILRTATRLLVPLLLLFSAFLLWRGHHEPGGGFVGGLVAATAFVLIALAEGTGEARRALAVAPTRLLALGLATSMVSGLAALAVGRPFLTGLWSKGEGAALALGTPLAFDVGVYLTVLGVVTATLLSLMEDGAPQREDEA
jgi:multisubunit Na+/H+ antiporter MnhB subunit